MNSTPASLPETSRLQRWLLTRLDHGRTGWPADQRERAFALDQHLVGRTGLGMVLGLLGGATGLALGLHGSGAGWAWALAIAECTSL